jgi:hypothetical protein
MHTNVPQLLDVRDVAHALRVSPYTVRHWSSGRNPKLRPVRLGRRLLFHPDEVACFVELARQLNDAPVSDGTEDDAVNLERAG